MDGANHARRLLARNGKPACATGANQQRNTGRQFQRAGQKSVAGTIYAKFHCSAGDAMIQSALDTLGVKPEFSIFRELALLS